MTVPRQKSGPRRAGNVSRRMAIDPPQAKAFEPDEKVPPITASHTLRMSDQKSGGSGAYQRYPVLAPTRVSVIDVDIDRDRGDAIPPKFRESGLQTDCFAAPP